MELWAYQALGLKACRAMGLWGHKHQLTQLFFFSDHQNWFGCDENLGPLAISIRREKVPVHPNAAELFLTPRNMDPDKDFRDQVSKNKA